MTTYEFAHYSAETSNPQIIAFLIVVASLMSFVMLGFGGLMIYSDMEKSFHAYSGWASEESIYGLTIRKSGIIGLFNRTYSI